MATRLLALPALIAQQRSGQNEHSAEYCEPLKVKGQTRPSPRAQDKRDP